MSRYDLALRLLVLFYQFIPVHTHALSQFVNSGEWSFFTFALNNELESGICGAIWKLRSSDISRTPTATKQPHVLSMQLMLVWNLINTVHYLHWNWPTFDALTQGLQQHSASNRNWYVDRSQTFTNIIIYSICSFYTWLRPHLELIWYKLEQVQHFGYDSSQK